MSWRFRDSGAEYKTPDLLTYLLTYLLVFAQQSLQPKLSLRRYGGVKRPRFI